jgi:serine/threonine protein kinase
MNGEVLGDRYEVQQQLGKRAGRRTLLARHLETQELVVVKLLSFGSDFEWEDLKLFEREAETLKALNHPFIPRYIDYFEIDSTNSTGFALVQTYIEAPSLEEQLKAGRTFSEAELKQLAKALLEILIYLHGRQPPVIHRDIKPSNILLSNRSGNNVGQVYLVDFGSVQTLAAREGGTITVVGTYGYMPQEQFGGRTVPASDLYSLGATLIALVTGTHPADLPQKDFQIQFEQASNLSPVMSRWLRWITQPALDQRLASAAVALQALEQEQLTRDSVPLVVRKPIGSVIKQPTGSKVYLTKNVDYLEILIPPLGFNCNVALVFLIYLVCWSFLLLPVLSGVDFLHFITLFGIIGGMGIQFLWIVLPALWGQIRFRIDRKQVSLTYELFGFKFNRSHRGSRQDITKLQCTRGSHITAFNMRPKLIVRGRFYKYELNGQNTMWGKLLTEPEIDWLAHELSEWLEIPITREELSPADR